jgi:Na+-driven multidrug efflux pump
MACGIAIAIMVLAGIIFYVAAEPLSAFFLGGYTSPVLPLAAHLLRIIAFVMLPLAVMMVFAGALRGAGDTRWPLAITIFGFILVRIPLAYYFINYLSLGVVGAWYAAIIDVTLRSILLSWRFFHGGWQHVEV